MTKTIKQPKPGSKEAQSRALREAAANASTPAKSKRTVRGRDPSPALAAAVTAAIGHAPVNAPKPKKAPKPFFDPNSKSVRAMAEDMRTGASLKKARAKEAKAKKAARKAKGASKTRTPRKPAVKPKAAPRPSAGPAQPLPAVREGSKVAEVGKLLLRAEGCTTKEVLSVTQWPSVSMPAQAKALSLTLRTEKEGRATRYFGSVTPV